MKDKFKVGDLVQMDNQFSPDRHPPPGTYGLVTDVEDWGDPTFDGNTDSDELIKAEQFIRVHWAHHKNSDEQCYVNFSLKKVITLK